MTIDPAIAFLIGGVSAAVLHCLLFSKPVRWFKSSPRPEAMATPEWMEEIGFEEHQGTMVYRIENRHSEGVKTAVIAIQRDYQITKKRVFEMIAEGERLVLAETEYDE